jgi:hypothetical protein
MFHTFRRNIFIYLLAEFAVIPCNSPLVTAVKLQANYGYRLRFAVNSLQTS